MKKNPPFSDAEVELLKTHWGTPEVLNYFPDRTYAALNTTASKLKIKKPLDKAVTVVANLTEAEKGYFAGHFDGEGCVLMHKMKRTICRQTYTLAVMVHISSYEVIQKYYKAFHGRVHSAPVCVNKPMWVWRIARLADAHQFIETVAPYLVEKREQAATALEWLNWRLTKTHRHTYSIEDSAYSDRCYKTLQELKRC